MEQPDTNQSITLPKEFEQNFPAETKMLIAGKIAEAIEALDNHLTAALESGDAPQAEKITAAQLFIAAILNDQESFKSIRAIRLELFLKTNQPDKAHKEYDALSLHCSKEHLQEILEMTGYEPSSKEAKPVNREMLDNIEIFFIVDMLRMNNNGVLHSVIRRMSAMAEIWGYKATMVTCEYFTELQGIIASLMHLSAHKTSSLPKGVKIKNVYEYFQKTHDTDALITHHAKNNPDLRYEEIKPHVYEVYGGTLKLRRESFTAPLNRLREIESFNEEGNKTHTIVYDNHGHPSYVRHYDKENPEHYTMDLHYTTEGKLCISKEYEYKEQKHFLTNSNSHVKRILVYDDDGNVIKICEDEPELARVYLERVAVSTNKLCIFINEGGLYSKSLVNLPYRNVKTASVLHSTMLENPYDLKSKPQIFFENMMKYQDTFDALIFFTDEQRGDFFELHGSPRRTFAIPHFYPKEITPVPFEERDAKKVVIVSRYDAIKRIDMAVQIFAKVAQEVEGLTLDIYGFGTAKEKERIQKAIEDLELEGIVKLKGGTDTPDKAFSSAAAFMLTSYVEGYAITAMESICNGCVPFAFDIKYGPNEIIINEETGFLIPLNNTADYAEKMTAFFNDPQMQRRMSEAAYKDAPRFSREAFLAKWHEMLESLYYHS